MWIRTLLGLVPKRTQTVENAFDPVTIDVNSLSPKGFREFSGSPRRQSGGVLGDGRRHRRVGADFGIIPNVISKIP